MGNDKASNLARLRAALKDLKAKPIAVPPFELSFLRRGHAIHFRSEHPDALRMPIDVMSKMSGVDVFQKLWRRRTVIELPEGTKCDLISLPDLVQAKKTQRDKDWPMMRRLVEAHYFENRHQGTASRVRFWLCELRTPELLIEVARAHPVACGELRRVRPLLTQALERDLDGLEDALKEEESAERERDRQYWLPLRRELEALRHAATRRGKRNRDVFIR